jgi:hypothetical protein
VLHRRGHNLNWYGTCFLLCTKRSTVYCSTAALSCSDNVACLLALVHHGFPFCFAACFSSVLKADRQVGPVWFPLPSELECCNIRNAKWTTNSRRGETPSQRLVFDVDTLNYQLVEWG